MDQKIGSWAFIIGVVIAIVTGIAVGLMPEVSGETWVSYVPLLLVILGLIVGFLNIGDKEVMPFLIASIALVMVGTVAELSTIPYIGIMLAKIVNYIAVFAAPAALVVALLEFYRLAVTPKGTAAK